MASSTRSKSANNTPVKSLPADPEPDTPTRKAPHCRTCNQPMKNHSRARCSSTSVKPASEKTETSAVEDKLGSMTITGTDDAPQKTAETQVKRKGRRSLGVSPQKVPFELEDTKQVIRERRKSEKAAALAPPYTLHSLSDSDENLLIPPPRLKDAKEVRWEKTLEMLSAGGTITTRPIMPGTLVTPSSSSVGTDVGTGDINSATSIEAILTSSASTSSASTSTATSTPSSRLPTRTMSMEERTDFMERLQELSTAKAYVLSKADLMKLKDLAPKGLYTKALMDEDGSDEGRNVLVVGRDEEGTEKLFRALEAEKKQAKRGVYMKSVAGGAALGAVATFTGLAFS